MPKRNIESSPSSSNQAQVNRPNKRRRLPVVLDHTSFPHIFDAIIEGVALCDLLNLRLVSRDLCTWADTRMARHILIDGRPNQHARESVSPTSPIGHPPTECFRAGEHPPSNTIHDSETDCQHLSMISSGDRLSSWPRVFMVDLTSSKTQIVPLSVLRPRSSSDGPLSQWLLDRNPFSGVKIADVIGTVPSRLRLLSGLPLQTVRFLDATLGFPECSVHAETMVLFARPPGRDDREQVSDGSNIVGLKRIVNNVTLPEPKPSDNFYAISDTESDTSEASTIRYDSPAVWCPTRSPTGPPPPIEVVFIFDPAWRHLPTNRMWHELDILVPLYVGASTLLPHTRFLLVGLEAVPLPALNTKPENMSAKLEWWDNLDTASEERLEFLAKAIMGKRCEDRRTFDSIDLQWTLSQLDIPEDMPIDQVRIKLQQAAPDPLEEEKRLLEYKMAKVRARVYNYIRMMRQRADYWPGYTETDYPDHPYREETWPDERIEAMVADGIVAYTYDEYRARVGEAQWRMETATYDWTSYA